MPRYRNIRVKMKGGRTRIQRALVLASGKLRFVKGKGRSSKRRSDRRTKRSVRGKKDYTFTKARRLSALRNLRKGRRKSHRSRKHRSKRSRRGIKRRRSSGGGIRLG